MYRPVSFSASLQIMNLNSPIVVELLMFYCNKQNKPVLVEWNWLFAVTNVPAKFIRNFWEQFMLRRKAG